MSTPTTPIEITLKNGLKVIVLEMPQATGITCQLSYKVCRRDEPAERAGINSAFLRTLHTDNYTTLLNQDFELFTFVNQSILEFTLKPDQLSKCFELNAKLMSTPILNESTLKRVLRSHLNHRESQKNFISIGSIPVEFDSLCHPIGYTSVGEVTPESATRIDIAQLQQWHQRYYSPGNSCLVVTGNVKADDVENLAKQYFDAVPSRPISPAQELPPCELDKRHFVVHKITSKPRLLIAFSLPGMREAVADKSGAALNILSALIEQKLTSHLPVSSGLCFYAQDKCASLFRVSVLSNTRDQSLGKLEEDLNNLIEDLKHAVQSPEELETARESALAQLPGDENHAKRALILGQLENYQIPFSEFDQRRDNLLNITASDLQRTAQVFFTPQRKTVVHILPLQPPARTAPVELILDNGLKIITLENPHATSVACTLNYKVSRRDETLENAGIHLVANTREAAESTADMTGHSIQSWHMDDFIHYVHICTPEKLSQAFNFHAKKMSTLVMTAETMREVIEDQLTSLERNRYFISSHSTPKAFDALAYPVSGYGNPWITPDSAANIDLETLHQWHHDYHSPGNACMVIVGNVKAAEIARMAKQQLGGVPARSKIPVKRVKELCEPGKRHITLHLNTEKPRLLVAFNVPGLIDDATGSSAAALQILLELFEQHYKDYLPVSNGLCVLTQNKDAGLFRISVTANDVDQSLTELETAVIGLLEGFKLNGAPADALETARGQAIGKRLKRDIDDEILAFELGQLEDSQLPLIHFAQRHDRLLDATAEDIHRAATLYFTNERLTVAHILPR
jgi:predicted Zn-dependent peptidase